MQVIKFLLQGKMAHFRKYYSNSTSLSYYIPPVTTVKGILAGLLGLERDSYYELFSNEKCQVAVGLENKVKKITQTMNLLKVENKNDLVGAGKNRTQNDTEWIIPENIRTGYLSYSVIVKHSDKKIFKRLTKLLVQEDMEGYYSEGISVALGSAQCLGWITGGKVFEATSTQIETVEAIDTRYAIPIENIYSINRKSNSIILKKEETLTEFDENRYITLKTKQDILLSADGKIINISLKPGVTYWTVDNQQVVFLGEV